MIRIWRSPIEERLYFMSVSYHYCLSVTLSCGGSASENQTYLIQSSVTTLTNPCKYTICPSGTDICRIRFDFTVRELDDFCSNYSQFILQNYVMKTLSYTFFIDLAFALSNNSSCTNLSYMSFFIPKKHASQGPTVL